MNIANIPTGTYIVAVSGGVDSVLLLELLACQAQLHLIVAHFDHGIRSDSAKDTQFVLQLAKRYGFPFVSERAELGPTTSENTARQARYAFLRKNKKHYNAAAIITAHHQDDVLETILINLQRGTGWRGITSLRQTDEILRPLLKFSKQEIVREAKSRQLSWREDVTNVSTQYQRNKIRQNVMPQLSDDTRRQLLAIIARQQELRTEIDHIVRLLLHANTEQIKDSIVLPRSWLIMLPRPVLYEIIGGAVYALHQRRIPFPMLRRIEWFVKTAKNYKTLQIGGTIAFRTTSEGVVMN